MRFLPLLGRKIRDDEVIEILEGLEMDVIYDFDRLHEDQPDRYWAGSKPNGFQFGFNAAQVLDAIFLYVTPDEGFAAVSQQDCDVPFFTTVGEAQTFGEARHLRVTKGRVNFLGVAREWARLGFPGYSVHYEFRGGNLALVTISPADEPHAI